MIIRYFSAERLLGFIAFTLIGTTQTFAQQPSKPQQLDVSEAQVSLIHNTFIASPISGVVEKVLVKEGNTVQPDALLIQLDDQRFRTELEAAVAAHQAAKLESDSDVDARHARRAKEFHVRQLEQSKQANSKFPGAISDSEVEKLRLVVDQATLAIEQAEHEQQVAIAHTSEKLAAVKIAEQRVRNHAIRASVGGQVAEITVQPGESVESGKPLIRVISLDPIRVECFIDGRKYGSELVGRQVKFVCEELPRANDASDRAAEFSGSVTFVSPEVHPVTGQVRLWATVDNPQTRLRSGLRGRLVITAESI
ncbi:multidrug efflux pump [Rhodopirellula maiorica SM1]|uniref:Multidrug efflux pump n=1 Tax=Rhodopirellula maiorica SM1 TaxID=1265738 RepID=M5RCN6_9BACT|nr:HlyD family efflux transporter periplasmic adaptor subunit [Rhodopirellula maiorica]EMI16811.1 multidrug efflux pump [Rhodopirellula maiorica SM1]